MKNKIKILDEIKNEIIKLKNQIQAEKQSYDQKILQIDGTDYSSKLLESIVSKYKIVNKYLDILKSYELLFSNKAQNYLKITEKFEQTANIDDNFIIFFENAYNSFVEFFSRFDKEGQRVFIDKDIEELNIYYDTLRYVYKNRERLVLKVLDEKNKKNQEKLKFADLKRDNVLKINQKIDSLYDNGRRLINELKLEIEENEKNSRFRDFSSFKGLPKSFETKVTLPIGKINSNREEYDLSFFNQKPLIYDKDDGFEEVDLSKNNANVAITYDEKQKNDESLWKIIESIVMRTLICYPSAFKNYAFIHNVKVNSDFLNIIGKLNLCSDNSSKLFLDSSSDKKVINTVYDTERLFQKISGVLDQRTIKCYGYNNILEYNKANPFMVEPLSFVFIKDIDVNTNQENIEYIREITKKCSKYGVYIFWLSTHESFKKVFNKEDANNFQKVYVYSSNDSLEINGIKSYPTIEFNSITRNTYELIKKDIVSFDRSISYEQFHDDINEDSLKEDDYGKILHIPFGREGQEIAYLDLNSQNEYSHVVITGTNGSGKSNLMHSIVLGAAEHYSPNELEFWIFDFKQGGVEFEPYSELKHCKYLGLRPNKADVLDILQHIQNIMSERSTIFNRAGVNDIHTYNRENPNNKMSRIIILIDEYGVLKSIKECTNILEDIVRRGRSFGMSLMMGSQIIEDGFETIIGQMRHRFLFGKDSNRHNYISEDLQKYGKYYDVIGTCAYESNKGVSIVRSTKIDDRKELIARINDKYSEINSSKPITLEDLSRKTLKVNINEYNPTLSFANKDIRTIKLGEQNLSRNLIEYKFSENNRILTLLGDSERAKNIEYSIINSYLSQENHETSIYYLNTIHYVENDIIGLLKEKQSSSIHFTNMPLEIGKVIRKVYEIYQERLEKIYRGLLSDGKPIHLIFHCADRLIDRLNHEKMIDDSSNEFDFGDFDDDIINRIKQNNSLNYGKATDSISVHEMLRKLINADKETKIYITLHFEQPSSLTKYEDNSFVSIIGIPASSDYLIIPTIPEEGEIISFVQIGDFLKNIGQLDLADAYYNRKVEVENDIKDKNVFEYCILIDDGNVRKFMPYEIEVNK